MIIDFSCKDTQKLWQGLQVIRFIEIEKVAMRKLAQLDAATTLNFLRIPPGNRLELLQGDRANQYSIRINNKWRLCFAFENGNAYQVAIVDYHK